MKKYEIVKLLEKYNDNDNIDFSYIGDDEPLEQWIRMGYIDKQSHPTLPLYIYNYTQKAQYEKQRNEYTISHRGLIKDNKGNIIARSFNKIFNYTELPKRKLQGEYSIVEKLDGSMLIVFYYDGEWHTATRGSFTSEQAIKGKEMIKGYKLDNKYTYIFEIIYPDNRVVVNYGDKERLVFLGKTDIEGNIYQCDDNIFIDKPKEYGIGDIETIKQLQKKQIDNFEGYICRNNEGHMFKVKLDEYIELHKVMTGYSEQKIFDEIIEGRTDFSEFPDELYKEIDSIKEYIKSEIDNISKQCILPLNKKDYLEHPFRSIIFKQIECGDTRKELLKFITFENYKGKN